MANCAAADVKMIIRTNLGDTDIGALITLADAEMTERGLDTRTANVKKLISMLLAAGLVSMHDPATRGIGEYSETVLKPEGWRQLAEDAIRRTGGLPFISVNDPIEGVDE